LAAGRKVGAKKTGTRRKQRMQKLQAAGRGSKQQAVGSRRQAGAEGRISRQEQLAGAAGRSSWQEQQVGAAGRSSRQEQQAGAEGRGCRQQAAG
jgi:hypothetical protein